MTFFAEMPANRFVFLSIVKPIEVMSVPFAPALVTTEFAPEALGKAQL